LKPPLHITRIILSCLAVLLAQWAGAQYKVRGTVYDSTFLKPVEAVTVLSSSGKGTSTDAQGRYSIDVAEKDSIWFSYLDKPTRKYPVLKIFDVGQFDIALQTYNQVLDEVKIKNRSYRMDSLQNRKDYAKIFDFRKPNLESMTSIGPTGAGIDLQELIRVFQFRKNKSTLKFQERLLQQEQDKFIDYRFNKGLVKRLTGLEGADLDVFMAMYRPSYEFILYTSEYDFQYYIKTAGEKFKTKPTF
jgi:hypothetical protein